jgi:hypothetical protein
MTDRSWSIPSIRPDLFLSICVVCEAPEKDAARPHEEAYLMDEPPGGFSAGSRAVFSCAQVPLYSGDVARVAPGGCCLRILTRLLPQTMTHPRFLVLSRPVQKLAGGVRPFCAQRWARCLAHQNLLTTP